MTAAKGFWARVFPPSQFEQDLNEAMEEAVRINSVARCGSCKFSLDRMSASAACHRFPPVLEDGATGFGRWPVVGSEDWCGEWRYDGRTDAPTDGGTES